MTQTAETLARIPLFRSLDEDAVRRFDAGCTWRRAGAKEWMFDYGSEGTDLFFVLHGHVRVVLTAAGREVILGDIRDGEFFGELAAIDQQPRSAGILAITDTLAARMPAGVFRRVVHEHPDACDQLLQTLVAQVRTLSNRINEQSNLGVRQRLYAELLRLARAPGNGDGRPVVSPPPTHAELAARVSSHREAITRELNALARGKLIERRRGAIVLLDAGRLRGMVSEPGGAWAASALVRWPRLCSPWLRLLGRQIRGQPLGAERERRPEEQLAALVLDGRNEVPPAPVWDRVAAGQQVTRDVGQEADRLVAGRPQIRQAAPVLVVQVALAVVRVDKITRHVLSRV